MNKRILRINAEIQRAVSQIITFELKNPSITGIISVVKVDTTNDLEYSKIYVSIFTEGNREEVFNLIKHSAGYIRKELAKKVDLRKMPYLQFYLDTSLDEHTKIDELIKQANITEKENDDEN